jgi:signal transduction histidine kinase
LQRTRQAAERLRRVVGALLTLFRTGSEPQRQSLVLHSLLGSLFFEGLAINADEGPALVADPDLLAAALLNLLDNALKHGATQVQVTEIAQDDSHSIVLQDNGSGLDEADRQRLQTALDAQDYEGKTGLGLMLADRVARAHGGQLRLLSSNAGCRVELRIGQPTRAR